MLEKENWKIPNPTPQQTQIPRPPSKWEPKIADWYDPKTRMLKISISDADLIANPEIHRMIKMLEYEIQRAQKPPEPPPQRPGSVPYTEKEFYEKYYQQYSDTQFRDMFERMRKQAEEEERYRREQEKQYYGPTGRRRRPFDIPFDFGVDWGKDNPFVTEPRKSAADATNKPKQNRECVRCHKTILTANINNIFVCNKCQWEEYPGGK